MNSITLGDPATQAGTPFTLLMPDTRGGTISIINESAYGLDFTIQNATFRVPADTKRDISVRGQISQQATWRIANNTNAAVAPISDVVVECYGLDECPVSNIQPLMRQTNVGNTSPVSTNVSQVLNDGNTAPVLVVEGTPSGAVGSQLKWNNDGSGIFGGGKASVDNAGILTLPAGAVPVASISAGDLPATTTVPVANLKAGALPSGVTLPVTQLTGSLPASQVGSGYPGAFVASPPWVNKVGDAMSGALAVVQALAGSNKNFLILDASDAKSWDVGVDTSGDLFFYNATDAINALSIGPTGVIVANGKTLLALASGALSGVNPISGSGSATVNHGLSATPDAAVVNNAAGTNSSTMGSGSYTATTVFIYQYTAMAWKGMVYKS